MKKIKTFFSTVFIGGLTVILPVAVLLQVFQWLLGWLTDIIKPLTGVILAKTQSNLFVAEVLGLVTILAGCFAVGLVVRTAGGQWIHNFLERWLLERIPGYATLKEFFGQLTAGQKRAFSKPVLFTFDGHKNYLLGYITAEYDDDCYAVFIPTSPSPLNGYVVQTRSENLKFLTVKPEEVMNTVIGCGVGSANIMASVDKQA